MRLELSQRPPNVRHILLPTLQHPPKPSNTARVYRIAARGHWRAESDFIDPGHPARHVRKAAPRM